MLTADSAVELFFPDFFDGFTVNALGCSRACLEAANPDLDPAMVAKTVLVGFEAQQCFVDLADEFAFAIPCAELQAELGFLGCPVIGIGEVHCLILHVMHGAIRFFHEIFFPSQQDPVKMLLLCRIHVSFVFPDRIGCNAFSERAQEGSARSGGLA